MEGLLLLVAAIGKIPKEETKTLTQRAKKTPRHIAENKESTEDTEKLQNKAAASCRTPRARSAC
jgi:hypothetical protein